MGGLRPRWVGLDSVTATMEMAWGWICWICAGPGGEAELSVNKDVGEARSWVGGAGSCICEGSVGSDGGGVVDGFTTTQFYKL